MAVLVAAIWGFNFVVIKVGLGEFPPLFFAMLRFTFVAFPAVFFVKRNGLPWKSIVAIGLVLGVAKFALLYIGMDWGLATGLASLLLQVQVIFTVVLARIFLQDRPLPVQLLGVGLAVIGIVFIGADKAAGSEILPFVIVVLAGFAWAIGNLLIKLSQISDAFRLFIWMGLVPPIPLLFLSLIFEQGQVEALLNLTWMGFGTILYTSLISTIVGFGLWGWLIHKHGPSAVVPFAFLVPVFGLASAALFLGDRFEINEIVGSLIVLLGSGLIVFARQITSFVLGVFARSHTVEAR